MSARETTTRSMSVIGMFRQQSQGRLTFRGVRVMSTALDPGRIN
jgi:hypothetical protein